MAAAATANRVLYVLKLEHDKYYVGTTKRERFLSRLEEHRSGDGQGAEWKSLHSPLPDESAIFELRSLDASNKFDEDHRTEQLMHEFGFDNVRGGTYSQVN